MEAFGGQSLNITVDTGESENAPGKRPGTCDDVTISLAIYNTCTFDLMPGRTS